MRRARRGTTMGQVKSTAPIERRRVVIVGGGVAALETVLALRTWAEKYVHVTVIAPEREFTPQALDIARPFAGGQAEHLDLERFMTEHGGRFRRTAVVSVDAERRTLSCTTGPDEHYDALVIAVGASARPAFDHAVTFGADFLACDELLADLEHERTQSVAFVVPEGCTWPLPLYELALTTAEQTRGTGSEEVRLHLVTPERRALDLFGTRRERSGHRVDAVGAHRPALRCGRGRPPRRTRGHRARPNPGGRPRRRARSPGGPAPLGLPTDAHGFIPVDEHGRVPGADAVYAAGDATDHRSSTADLPASRPTPSLPMSQLSPARRSTPSPIGPYCAGGCSPDLASASFGAGKPRLANGPSAVVAAGEGFGPISRAVSRAAGTRGPPAAQE